MIKEYIYIAMLLKYGSAPNHTPVIHRQLFYLASHQPRPASANDGLWYLRTANQKPFA